MNLKIVAVTATAVMMALASASCSKYSLDRQMAELCKKDGGVKVYETATLSLADYEALTKYVVKAKLTADYYGPKYRYVDECKNLVGTDDGPEKGRGRLTRCYTAIYIRSENRLLGESVWYSRVGGDVFTFGFQPSGNSCPNPSLSLQKSVFLKGK
jgi:hypothetical protein